MYSQGNDAAAACLTELTVFDILDLQLRGTPNGNGYQGPEKVIAFRSGRK